MMVTMIREVDLCLGDKLDPFKLGFSGSPELNFSPPMEGSVRGGPEAGRDSLRQCSEIM